MATARSISPVSTQSSLSYTSTGSLSDGELPRVPMAPFFLDGLSRGALPLAPQPLAVPVPPPPYSQVLNTGRVDTVASDSASDSDSESDGDQLPSYEHTVAVIGRPGDLIGAEAAQVPSRETQIWRRCLYNLGADISRAASLGLVASVAWGDTPMLSVQLLMPSTGTAGIPVAGTLEGVPHQSAQDAPVVLGLVGACVMPAIALAIPQPRTSSEYVTTGLRAGIMAGAIVAFSRAAGGVLAQPTTFLLHGEDTASAVDASLTLTMEPDLSWSAVQGFAVAYGSILVVEGVVRELPAGTWSAVLDHGVDAVVWLGARSGARAFCRWLGAGLGERGRADFEEERETRV